MNSLCYLLVLLCSFACLCFCKNDIHPSTLSKPAINPALIDEINNKQGKWVAGINSMFKDWDMRRVQRLLGWKKNPNNVLRMKNVVARGIPDSFDSKQQWPNCATIGTIYNQAECGSCWAFGCVEAASDRFCIQSKGAINYVLSFYDMVTCGPDDGCDGGDAGDAWEYIESSGLVTNTCSPYDIPTCPPAEQPCMNFVPTPDCVQTCSDSEVWTSSLHFNSQTYGVSSDVAAIQTEIMTNGPVEVCFDVYEDFLNYKSGVYTQTSGDFLGGHCVKMLGWGVENGQPYWLCNNSWTTYWGDNGTFKILRGADECGIEDGVVAGMPTV